MSEGELVLKFGSAVLTALVCVLLLNAGLGLLALVVMDYVAYNAGARWGRPTSE